MNVDNVIENFHSFLVTTYSILKNIENRFDEDYFEEIKNDFYQSNWELLVESVICIAGKEYLLEYGEGAECNARSSRVSFPTKQANTQIVCNSENEVKDIVTGSIIKIEEYHFNSFMNILQEEKNKLFRYLKLEHNFLDEYAIIKFNNISFTKRNIPDTQNI